MTNAATNCMRLGVFAVALLTLGSGSFAAAADTHVEFELVTEKGFPPASTQKWFQTFTDLKVAGVRIRAAEPADRPKIDVVGKKESPRYKVVGSITARGVLVVPGGQFTVNDGPRIAKWMRELANNGVEGVTTAKSEFGLTKTQLEQVTSDLARPLESSTKGIKATEVAKTLVTGLKLKVTVHDDVKRAWPKTILCATSCAVCRAEPHWPRSYDQRVQSFGRQNPRGASWAIASSRRLRIQSRGPSACPATQPASKLAPKLFEFLNAEIEGVTAAEAIDAIGQRLEVPLLFDHNNMARHRIDLTQEITLPGKRTYYSKVLDQVLFAVDLKYELRVDENGKPFLWITTVKR